MRPLIERYSADLRDYQRVYPLAASPTRRAKLDEFFVSQIHLLQSVNFDALSWDGRIDYTLFLNHLQHQREQLKDDDRKNAEIAPLLPYQSFVIDFEEARRRMEPLDIHKAADTLTAALADIKKASSKVPDPKPRPGLLARAANRINELRGALKWWHDFYNLYDPEFAWWVDGLYKQVDSAMDQHLRALLTAAGIKLPPENAPIPEPPFGGGGRRFGSEFSAPPESGDLAGAGPAGRDVLVEALRYNMIAYTPEELIVIANQEFAWCDKEMLRASNELGFGDLLPKVSGSLRTARGSRWHKRELRPDGHAAVQPGRP